MTKLTGYGRPSNHLEGSVGQHYEDLNTGDIYECRIASRWSPTHGAPVGGYVWELRAKGEDISDIYGSVGGGSGLTIIELKLEADNYDDVIRVNESASAKLDAAAEVKNAIVIKCEMVDSTDATVTHSTFVVFLNLFIVNGVAGFIGIGPNNQNVQLYRDSDSWAFVISDI